MGARTRTGSSTEKKVVLEKGLLTESPAKDPELVQAKRHQIVDGACRLFFKKGFHPTTIREVAKACDMSMGQLYHYISSKDDILYLAFEQINRTWKKNVLENPAIDENLDPKKQLRVFIELTLRNSIHQARLIQFVFTEAKHLDKKHLAAVLEMDRTGVIQHWKDLLVRINEEEKIIDDVDFAANWIAYEVNFIALRRWNLKQRSTEENIGLLTQIILKGLGV